MSIECGECEWDAEAEVKRLTEIDRERAASTLALAERQGARIHELRDENERLGIDMRAWKQWAETAEAENERLQAIKNAAVRMYAQRETSDRRLIDTLGDWLEARDALYAAVAQLDSSAANPVATSRLDGSG